MSVPVRKTARLPSGLVLPYLEQSAWGSPTLLFLHGLTDSCRSYETVMAHLPATMRAVAPSLRGHAGASVPESYRLVDLAADLRGFMDVLSLERVVLVGHSMGAAIAQRLAIDHPDRVLGLVLVGAFPTLGRNPACVAFEETSIASLADPIDPSFVRAFQESTLAQPVADAFLDGVVAESLQVPARVWKAVWSALLSTDLTPELPHITAPSVLVWGDRDDIALRDDQDILRRLIPKACLVTFDDAGHAPHWEEPERFAGVVADFANWVAPSYRKQQRPEREAESAHPA